MKNKLFSIVFVVLVLASWGQPLAWGQELGIFGAWRTVTDEEIQEFYGKGGFVYFPYLAITFNPKLTIGVGYEGGYKKTAELGIFKEPATLSVQGFEVFADYNIATDSLVPFFHFGVGFYTFKQDVDSPYAEKIEEKHAAMTVGGGIKYYLSGGFFAGVEIKYVPLEIQMQNKNVNLGGIRAGIRLGFNFQQN